MPTTEYSPIIEAAGTLDSLRKDVEIMDEQVADLRTFVGKLRNANDDVVVRGLAEELDDLRADLADHFRTVEASVRTAIDEVNDAIENAAIEAPPDDSQLVDAVLDVERGLDTWADVVALARKLA